MTDQCANCKHLKPFSGGCQAYPDGVPFKFSNNEEIHDKPQPKQVGVFVFEEGEPDEIKQLGK